MCCRLREASATAPRATFRRPPPRPASSHTGALGRPAPPPLPRSCPSVSWALQAQMAGRSEPAAGPLLPPAPGSSKCRSRSRRLEGPPPLHSSGLWSRPQRGSRSHGQWGRRRGCDPVSWNSKCPPRGMVRPGTCWRDPSRVTAGSGKGEAQGPGDAGGPLSPSVCRCACRAREGQGELAGGAWAQSLRSLACGVGGCGSCGPRTSGAARRSVQIRVARGAKVHGHLGCR